MRLGWGRGSERLLTVSSAPQSADDREDWPDPGMLASIHRLSSHQFHFEGSGFRKVLVAQ